MSAFCATWASATNDAVLSAYQLLHRIVPFVAYHPNTITIDGEDGAT